MVFGVPGAFAHGPCSVTGPCLEPTSGPPGEEVTVVGTVAYRVVWNEAVDYMGSPSNRASVPAIPRTERLVNGYQKVIRGLTFTVPDVPPGRYPVVIYDGSEGGAHYTWDYFNVTAPSESALWPRSRAFLLAVVLACGAVTATWLLYRRQPNSEVRA